jgi:hypothetical protein
VIERQVEALAEGCSDPPRIINIEPFLKCKLFEHNFAERHYHHFPGSTGLRIEFSGTASSSYLIFHVI